MEKYCVNCMRKCDATKRTGPQPVLLFVCLLSDPAGPDMPDMHLPIYGSVKEDMKYMCLSEGLFLCRVFQVEQRPPGSRKQRVPWLAVLPWRPRLLSLCLPRCPRWPSQSDHAIRPAAGRHTLKSLKTLAVEI